MSSVYDLIDTLEGDELSKKELKNAYQQSKEIALRTWFKVCILLFPFTWYFMGGHSFDFFNPLAFALSWLWPAFWASFPSGIGCMFYRNHLVHKLAPNVILAPCAYNQFRLVRKPHS